MSTTTFSKILVTGATGNIGKELTKLLSEKGISKIYNLTGPESLTHEEIAKKLSKATDRTIKFIDITPDMLHETLLQVGFPKWQAEGLVEDYAHYKAGEASDVKSGIMEATGKEPIRFDQFAKDYARYFSA